MLDDNNVFAEMAAALNNHQITDSEGQIAEETAIEDTASQEINTDDEFAQADKPAEVEETSSQTPEATDETDYVGLAEDESGKRYVPESRFKEVYGKSKATERELQALKEQLAKGDALMRQSENPKTSKKTQQDNSAAQPSKADLLELKMTLPQFDPKLDENGVPTNPDYVEELDQLGYDLWKANPALTPLEAARQALKYAKSLSKKQSEAVAEARLVKSIQSDQGITSRVGQRTPQQVDIDSMSDTEMEAYLKSTGQW